MGTNKTKADKLADLRAEAQARLAKRFAKLQNESGGNTDKLVHELQVHQIELEMQNEELRRAQAELEQSQARYCDLYDFAPVGYFTFDANGHVVEANLTGCRMLGVERSVLIKKPFSSFVDRDSQDTFYKHRRAALTPGVSQTCEITLVRKSGDKFEATLESTAAMDDKGNPALCRTIVADITERKHTEESLRQSEKTLSELVERAPFGMYIVDSQFRIAQMNLGSQNGAFRNVRPVIGRDFAEAMRILWPEPVAAEIIAVFRRTLETGEPYYSPPFVNPRHDVSTVESYEWELHRMTLPDGQYGVICYYFDSTTLREAEAAVRESESKYRIVANNTYDWEFWCGPDGQFLYCSPSCERITGYTAQEFMADSGLRSRLIHPDDRQRFEEHQHDVEQRQLAGEGEWRFLRPDGTSHWVTHACQPVFDEHGTYLGCRGSNRDITARKQAEQAMRQSEQRLRQLIETSPVAIGFGDSTGKIFEANESFYRLTGYSREEIRSRQLGWDQLTAPEYAELDRQIMATLAATGSAGPYEKEYIRKDGSRIPLLLSVSKLPAGQDEHIAFIVDMSERKHTEMVLEWDARRDELLSKMATRLLESKDPQGLIEELCRQVCEFLDCQIFFNYLVDEQAGRLHLNACTGIPEEQAHKIEWLDYGVAVCGCVARDRQRIITEDIQNTPDPRTNLVKSHGIQAYCCHPLIIQGRLIGTLSFGTRTRPRLSPDDIEVMQEVCGLVAIAMSRIETERALRDSNEELNRFNRVMVGRESRMIDLKKQVNELCVQAGQPPRYKLDFENDKARDKTL